MPYQTWEEAVITSQSSGSAIGNTGQFTSLLPSGSIYTFAADAITTNQVIIIKASGLFSTAAGSVTQLMGPFINGVSIGNYFATTGFNPLTSITNGYWSYECRVPFQIIGGSPFLGGVLEILNMSNATGTTSSKIFGLGATTWGTNGTLSDSTIDLQFYWTSWTTPDSIQLLDYSLEVVN